MQLEIRALTAADAAEFHALRLRGLQESPEAFGSTYEEDVALSLDVVAQRIAASRAPRKIVLGAIRDGALVGVIGCFQEPKIKLRHTATIWGMYVAPEARGGGVARRLLDDVIAEVRTWPDVVRITLSVVDRAAAARELYPSAGFQSFGREPDAFRQNGVRDTVEHLVLRLDTHRP